MGSWGYNGTIFSLPILVTGRVPPTLLVFYLMGNLFKGQQKKDKCHVSCRE